LSSLAATKQQVWASNIWALASNHLPVPTSPHLYPRATAVAGSKHHRSSRLEA